jgi:hypothetical protein
MPPIAPKYSPTNSSVLSTQVTREVKPAAPLDPPLAKRTNAALALPFTPLGLPRFTAPSLTRLTPTSAAGQAPALSRQLLSVPLSIESLFSDTALQPLAPKKNSGPNFPNLAVEPIAPQARRVQTLPIASAPAALPLRDPNTGSLQDRSLVEAGVSFAKGSVSTSLIQQIDNFARTASRLRGIEPALTDAQSERQRIRSTTQAERIGIGFSANILNTLLDAVEAKLNKRAVRNLAASDPNGPAFKPAFQNGRVYRGPDGSRIIDTVAKDRPAKGETPQKAQPVQDQKVTASSIESQLGKARSNRDVLTVYDQLQRKSPELANQPSIKDMFKRAYGRIAGESDAAFVPNVRLQAQPSKPSQPEPIPPNSTTRGTAIDPSFIAPSVVVDFQKLDSLKAFRGLQRFEQGDPDPQKQATDGKYLANRYFRNAFAGLREGFGTSKLTQTQISLTTTYVSQSSGANSFSRENSEDQLDPDLGYYGTGQLPKKLPATPYFINSFKFEPPHDLHLFFNGFNRQFAPKESNLQLSDGGESSLFARLTDYPLVDFAQLSSNKAERHAYFEEILTNVLTAFFPSSSSVEAAKLAVSINNDDYRNIVALSTEAPTNKFISLSPIRQQVNIFMKQGYLANPITRPALMDAFREMVGTEANSPARRAAVQKLVDINLQTIEKTRTPSVAAIAGQLQLTEALNLFVYSKILPSRESEKEIDFSEFYDFYRDQVDQGNLVTYEMTERWMRAITDNYGP